MSQIQIADLAGSASFLVDLANTDTARIVGGYRCGTAKYLMDEVTNAIDNVNNGIAAITNDPNTTVTPIDSNTTTVIVDGEKVEPSACGVYLIPPRHPGRSRRYHFC